MRKLRKKRIAQPSINTASLPDIVFMLLFFFMSVTVLRVQMTELELQLPSAKETVKLKRNALLSYIYIAEHTGENSNKKDYTIQLNNEIIDIDNLSKAIRELKAELPNEKIAQYRCLIKVDENIKMRIIDKVKDELRASEQYKITYASIKKSNPNAN